MGNHRKLPRLGKRKKEVLLLLHMWLGATVEDDFPLGPDEIPVRLYTKGVFVEQLLANMSGVRHYLRPLDGMMLEIASDDVRAEYEELYNELQRRQWFLSCPVCIGKCAERTEREEFRFWQKGQRKWEEKELCLWKLEPYLRLKELDDCELSVRGKSVLGGFTSLRTTKAWKVRWGSLEAACYAAINALERDRYVWRRRFKSNRVNEVMKIGLTMRGLQYSRALMEEAFAEYAVELREGFAKAGLPEAEHNRLVAAFRPRFGLVRPAPSD